MDIRKAKAGSRSATAAERVALKTAQRKRRMAALAPKRAKGRNRRPAVQASPAPSAPEAPAPVQGEPTPSPLGVEMMVRRDAMMRQPESEEVDPRAAEMAEEFSRAELAAECQALGLPVRGSKLELAARLVAHDSAEDAEGSDAS